MNDSTYRSCSGSFQVLLLGPFQVWRDEKQFEVSAWTRRSKTLLKLLATTTDRGRLRDELIELLWPDALPKRGAANLRVVIHDLRQELGGLRPSPVLVEGGRISLNPKYRWDIDLARFETLLHSAGNKVSILEEALDMVPREVLAEDRYEDWASPIRQRIDKEWREGCVHLASLYRTCGRQDRAVHWLQQVLERDPLDEEALRCLLCVLGEMGRRIDAIRKYYQFEQQLRAELDVEPSEETRVIADSLKAQVERVSSSSPGGVARGSVTPPETLPEGVWREADRRGDAMEIGHGGADFVHQFEHRLPTGGFLGSLPTGPLVAREQELARIRAAGNAVERGEGRLVMLAGEPGIGKTRLAQEATVALRNRGFLVVTGRCYETRQAAFYPFLDALTTLYEGTPAALRQEAPRRWPYLGRLLPDQMLAPPLASSAGQEEQELLFRAVAGLIIAVAERVPVAVLLDDLHWADSASLDLLQHLARHTRAYPVLLLGTYRDVEWKRHRFLQHVLHDLNRERLADLIPIQRLVQVGTTALMMATFDEPEISTEFAGLIHDRTEGNPFFIQELLRALVERGDVYQENGRWQRRPVTEIEVPESIRSTIGERLFRLSETAQEILHEACILGQTFRFDDLQAIRGRLEDEVDDALMEATETALVRETGQDRYEFNHALIQQALYHDLSNRRRRKLHLMAGESLERLPEQVKEKRVVELAQHFLKGGDPQRSLRYELLAGDQAEAVYGHRDAIEHYRRASDLARQVGNRDALAEALQKAGLALRVVGEQAEALSLLEEAARLHRDLENPVLEGRVMVAAAALYGESGLGDKQREAIERVEGLLDSVKQHAPTCDVAALYHELGNLYFFQARYTDKLAMSERELAVAQALGDDQLLTWARAGWSEVLGAWGRFPEAYRVALDLIPAAEALNDLDSLRIAYAQAAQGAMAEGAFEQSRKYREREVEVIERLGSLFWKVFTVSNLAHVVMYMGDYPAAGDHARSALNLARSAGNVAVSMPPLLFLGELAFREGDWEEASCFLEECLAIAEGLNDLQVLRYGQRLLAERDLQAGHPEAALARLQPLLDRPGMEESDVTNFLPTLAEAHLVLNDVERAAELAAQSVDRAPRAAGQPVLPDALRVQGLVLAHQQRWNEARAAFEEAISLAHSMPYPYGEASILHDYGMTLARRGTALKAEARKRLEQALAIFRRLGSRKDIERLEVILE